MKCTECGKPFSTLGRGRGRQVTCSLECSKVRENRQRNDYRRKVRAGKEGSVKCDHCGVKVDYRQFLTVSGVERGLCASCAALVRATDARTSDAHRRTVQARALKSEQDRELLAPLDALVRQRKPDGRIRWWR